ncbi:MAG: hypothetical protein A3C47_07015 [Omnitrophica bacterium RIFCSPHIGHO2_02_FULL_51_18]|nr:MAG: hypothetical protein A3C47_07015 [Omnitrophica bacterium RIFCSPHIGHO2_02_FULL_51_18]
MPRFHIEASQIDNGTVRLNPKESRHALSVLRLNIGDTVDLFDGQGRGFSGVISRLEKGSVEVMITQNSKTVQERIHLTLGISVIKPEAMDLVVQKACELGVHSIQPLITERCVVKLPYGRWLSKIERWKKIALESCKQCGRTKTPEVWAASGLKIFSKEFGAYDLVLLPTLAKKGEGLYDILFSKPAVRKVLVLIGPEGDFTENEVGLMESAGARALDLGPWVLRSETAALYSLSVLQFMFREVLRG